MCTAARPTISTQIRRFTGAQSGSLSALALSFLPTDAQVPRRATRSAHTGISNGWVRTFLHEHKNIWS